MKRRDGSSILRGLQQLAERGDAAGFAALEREAQQKNLLTFDQWVDVGQFQVILDRKVREVRV